MTNHSKEIRTLQLAAIALLKNFRSISIKEINSIYYDLLVVHKDSDLRFGVTVVNSGFLRTSRYTQYLQDLASIDLSDSNNRIPILIVAVNEVEESVRIGFQVGWSNSNGKARIFNKPSMMEVTPLNSDKFLDFIKSMDETIRVLSLHGMKIIKRIDLNYQDRTGRIYHSQIVYLRDFTEQYKMRQKEIVDEREKFERLLNGIPENEYPNDFLDDAILEMIRSEFPDAIMRSNAMLFSTDLRNIQQLSQVNRVSIQFFVEPDMNELPQYAYELINGINIVHFELCAFLDLANDIPIFENRSFRKIVTFNGWLNTYNEYNKAIATLHSPMEFFVI